MGMLTSRGLRRIRNQNKGNGNTANYGNLFNSNIYTNMNNSQQKSYPNPNGTPARQTVKNNK